MNALNEDDLFTEEDVLEVDRLVQAVLLPIRTFVRQATAAVIPPEVFVLVPMHQVRLQNLINCFHSLCDYLPADYFDTTKWDMLEAQDRLRAVEEFGTLSGNLKPVFQTLAWEIGPNNRSRLAIPREFVEVMLDEADLTIKEVAQLLGCGKRTLKRRLREWSIKRREQNISDEDLGRTLYNIKRTVGAFWGERAMMGMLHAMGYWAPRQDIRRHLRRIDPQGINERWARAIYRRRYCVPFINSLWHIDGHHRLRRWGFVTHGGIDGRSHVITFLACSDNNRADTVGDLFHEATKEWGWPSRVRADWGGENVIVKDMMEHVRGCGRGSFFAGPSVHNQRVERLWRDVFAWTIALFHGVFTAMEDIGILNPDNPLHLWALHLIFTQRINANLKAFVATWNNHKMSTRKNKTPLQLYHRGMIDAAQRGFFLNPCPGAIADMPLDDDHPEVQRHAGMDFTMYGTDIYGNQREREEYDPNVEVNPVAVENLSVADGDAIKAIVDREIDEEGDLWGYAKYQRAIQLASFLLLQHQHGNNVYY